MPEEVFGGGGAGGVGNIFAGTNITISTSGNSATIIGGVNTGATTFIAGMTGTNTAGTAGTVNNQMLFAGGNNISLSQSINGGSATITFIGRNPQTGISSIQGSDATYTSGKVIFTGSNMVTVKSGAGQQVIIDATQTVQPEGTIFFGVSSGGNTLGTTGLASGTGPRLVLVGGSNITLSQSIDAGGSSGTVTIIGESGASGGGAQLTVGGNSTSAGAGYILISSGTATFAGGNNITLSQDGNAITISGANIGGAQTGISGIAGSGASTVTAGTVQFQNSNGVSFGLNGSTMTASHDGITAQSVQTQGSVLVNGSSGAISFNAGNLMSLSTVASALTFINLASSATHIQEVSSATAAGAMVSRFANEDHVHAGVGPAGISSGGNTLGNTGALFGRLVFAGGSNITLSGSSSNNNAQTITIIGASGGGAGYTAGLSTGGNTSGDATNVTGRLIFAGGNNITLSGSTNAGSMTITISAPSGGGAGVSSGGNTAGTTGTVDYQLVFVGGSNISLSQSIDGSSGTITINGASGGGGGFQSAGVSSGGNTAGTTGLVSSQLVFIGGSNVTLSQSSGAGLGTITINAVQSTGFLNSISAGGNTSGDVTAGTGRLGLMGGNNITLSGSTAAGGMTLTISGPTGGGAGMGSAGNSAGTTGTVGKELYFVGGSNVSLSQSVNGQSATLTINGATAAGAVIGTSVESVASANSTGSVTRYAPEDHRHAGVFALGVSTGGNTLGNTTVFPGGFVLVGGSNITLSQGTAAGNQATITIVGASGGGGGVAAGMTNTGNTAGDQFSSTTGTVFFQGTNNITVSASTGGASVNTIWISGPTGGGAGMSTQGNTAGTTGTVGKELVFVGGSNITLSQSVNGASATLTINGATAAGGGATVNGSTGNVSFAAGNNMSLSTAGSTLTYINVLSSSAIAQPVSNVSSAGTLASRFALADHAHLGVAGIVPNATASSFVGYLNLSAGNLMSLASGGNSSAGSLQIINLLSSSAQVQPVSSASSAGTNASRFALADHAHAGVFSIGVSTDGNTAGSTAVLPGRMIFVGGNSISLSQSTSAGNLMTVTINGPNGMVAGMLESGNTTASTFLASNRLVLVGGNNITLSGSSNGGSGTIVISGPPDGTLSQWMPRGLGVSSFQQIGQSTLAMFPIHLEGFVSVSRGDVFVSNSVSTSSNSSHQGTLSLAIGIYTRNVSTMSLASSGSVSYTWNITGSTSSGSIVGMRNITVPINASMTPGVYYMGILSQTASSQNNWVTLSNLALVAFPNAFSGPFGGATNASNQFIPGLGIFSAQTAALPASVAFGGLLASSASTGRPIVNFMNYTA